MSSIGMLNFDPEEHRKKQEKLKKKQLARDRKKKISKAIVGTIVFAVLLFILSVTEMGCKYFQDYIDSQVKPFIEQAKLTDESIKYDSYGERYQTFYLRNSEDFQKLMAANFKDSRLISLQNYIAYVNSFTGRNFHAYKSFQKYYTYFSPLISKEKSLEILYLEISIAKDSGQYKDCGQLIEDFRYEYDPNPSGAGQWYEKVKKVELFWTQIPQSIRAVNQPQLY